MKRGTDQPQFFARRRMSTESDQSGAAPQLDRQAVLSGLSAQVKAGSKEPLSIGGQEVSAHAALKVCPISSLAQAVADGRKADAGQSESAGSSLSNLLREMQGPAQQLGEALLTLEGCLQEKGSVQKERAAECAPLVPRCPVSGEEMVWPASLASVFKECCERHPPKPAEAAAPTAAAEGGDGAAAAPVAAPPAAPPQPPEWPPGGKGDWAKGGWTGKGGYKGGAKAKGGKGGGGADGEEGGKGGKGQAAVPVPQGLGGALMKRMAISIHALIAGVMPPGFIDHQPPDDDDAKMAEDDTAPEGADGAAEGAAAEGAAEGAVDGAAGKGKGGGKGGGRESKWRCRECGATSMKHGVWRWHALGSGTSLCAFCRPAPPDATDLFLGARVRLRPDHRERRYAWAPTPGVHGVVRQMSDSEVTVHFHRAPGPWRGEPRELDVSPEMRFAFDEGEGDEESKPDVLYEAMDAGGRWWPCTVLSRGPGELLKVRVQDGGEGGGTLWPEVHGHLIRPKAGGVAAWQKGTGYSIDDDMDERDLRRAAEAAKLRLQQQTEADVVLSGALSAVTDSLQDWPRGGDGCVDLPLYPHFAAVIHGPIPVATERLLLNDSLHAIAERADVYHNLIKLLKVLGGDSCLAELLVLAPADAPRTRTPERLLRAIGEQAKVFTRDSSAIERALDQTDEETASVYMALEFRDVLEKVQAALARRTDRPAEEDSAEKEEPMEEDVFTPELRFASLDMQQGAASYPHTYKAEIAASEHKRPTAQGKRIKELATLSTSLPDGIFLRHDERRADVMKAMIIGPDDTPYQGGCFVFDIFLPTEYPNEPPKVNMVTTHGRQVRFNPNLYADGKVCLSLLGTWDGPGWKPKESTLLQVLLSIQSMIMVADPYYNEPGFESDAATAEGRETACKYNEFIRLYTAKVAVLDQIRVPHPDFADVIKLHFATRKEKLKKQFAEWLPAEGEKKGPSDDAHHLMGFEGGPYGVGGSPALARQNFNPTTVRRRVLAALDGAVEQDDTAAPAAEASPGRSQPTAPTPPPPPQGLFSSLKAIAKASEPAELAELSKQIEAIEERLATASAEETPELRATLERLQQEKRKASEGLLDGQLAKVMQWADAQKKPAGKMEVD
eukprot:TRINITY_DN487_c3_g1_i1.p1 TRINITY_DN487_c3_g1~~TRINITY_DN487_c3_g1_i1.p1  ORF type:complete len:1123 (+),score=366.57 TRINITY_DN487_c3_g1_i1:117-3485(+)